MKVRYIYICVLGLLMFLCNDLFSQEAEFAMYRIKIKDKYLTYTTNNGNNNLVLEPLREGKNNISQCFLIKHGYKDAGWVNIFTAADPNKVMYILKGSGVNLGTYPTGLGNNVKLCLNGDGSYTIKNPDGSLAIRQYFNDNNLWLVETDKYPQFGDDVKKFTFEKVNPTKL
ncbi:MAG: hypothetical protein ACEPOV_10265 [Hyphomicrobiales bacterium]